MRSRRLASGLGAVQIDANIIHRQPTQHKPIKSAIFPRRQSRSCVCSNHCKCCHGNRKIARAQFGICCINLISPIVCLRIRLRLAISLAHKPEIYSSRRFICVQFLIEQECSQLHVSVNQPMNLTTSQKPSCYIFGVQLSKIKGALALNIQPIFF